MIRSRRFALVAAVPALLVLSLSACGDATDPSGLGEGAAPAVIHIGANSGGSKLAGGSAAAESSDAAMWAPWVNYTYSFSGDASALPASASAWSFSSGGAIDESRFQAIAASFGLTGSVEALPAEYGGGWVIGSADYTGPSLMVGTDGMLSWWYNPGPMSAEGVRVDCAVIAEDTAAVDATGESAASGSGASSGSAGSDDTAVVDPTTGEDPCVYVEPEPPANVPTKDEAEGLFRALLADWGYDTADVTLETYADEWGAYVTGFLSLGGFRSPASVSAGFGENGAVTWASGTLATAQPAGEYPLISVDEAIARLNDRTGKWGWFGGWSAYAKGGIAVDAATTGVAESAVEGPGAASSDVAVAPIAECDPAADCVIDPMPTEPEEVAVDLTGVTLDVTTVWGEDGTVYVLPAYTFTGADGMTATMVAVGEEYLDLPEVTEVPGDVVPGDTGTIDTGTLDPGTITTDVVTPGTDVVTPTPETVPAEIDPAAAEASLVGLALDEATKVAEGAGWTLRVSTIDGEGQALTDDFQFLRVNVAVEAGVVTAVEFIG